MREGTRQCAHFGLLPRLSLVLVTLFLVCPARSAVVYSNAIEHFSVAIPDGWLKLSDAQVSAINSKLVGEKPRDNFYEAAYRAPRGSPHAGAMIFISYAPGYMGSLTEFAAGIQHGAKGAAERYHSQNNNLGAVPDPQVFIDEHKHLVELDTTVPTAVGIMASQSVSYLGRDGIADVTWTDREDRSAMTDQTPSDTFGTFRFDPGYEYDDAKPIKSVDNAYEVGTVVGKAICFLTGAAIVLVGLGLFLWLWLRKKPRLPN